MTANTLENYVQRFTHLHTDVNRSRWTAATRHRAPHKPFLVLSVIDLIETGVIQSNLIELTMELGETFTRYWMCVLPPTPKARLTLPFFHLRSEGFWHLQAQPGKEAVLEEIHQVHSLRKLSELVSGAQIDESLFALLCTPEGRLALRQALIEGYFEPSLQPALWEQAAVNAEAIEYSRELLRQTGSLVREALQDQNRYRPVARDQGFRRAVVLAYARRCGLCGIRVLTFDGHTAVDAAHIVPWSETQDDAPNNGIALCRLCHWAFDEGLLAVSANYTVLTSVQLRREPNLPAHLDALTGRGMIRPEEEQFWPNPEALTWHRRNVYRPM